MNSVSINRERMPFLMGEFKTQLNVQFLSGYSIHPSVLALQDCDNDEVAW